MFPFTTVPDDLSLSLSLSHTHVPTSHSPSSCWNQPQQPMQPAQTRTTTRGAQVPAQLSCIRTYISVARANKVFHNCSVDKHSPWPWHSFDRCPLKNSAPVKSCPCSTVLFVKLSLLYTSPLQFLPLFFFFFLLFFFFFFIVSFLR